MLFPERGRKQEQVKKAKLSPEPGYGVLFVFSRVCRKQEMTASILYGLMKA